MSYRESKTIDEQQSIIVIRLRQLRKLKNESQEELAEAIDEKRPPFRILSRARANFHLS